MADPLQLPPLPATEPSWGSFQVWWQQVKAAVERNALVQQSLLDEIDAAVSGPGGAGDQVAILGSFTIPTMILTATDVGSNVTISVIGHIRQYANGVQTPVAAGSLTGNAFSTKYAVYYDDDTRINNTPTFVATTDLEVAQHNYAPGRHYCGTVTTPADGAGPTTAGSPPAGSGYTAGASAVVIP